VTASLRLEAPAKLNLSLRVTGRRDDGLHELDSVLILLELADRLLLMPGCSGFRVEGRGAAELPVDDTNLAWRGLLAGLEGEPDLACLTLDKAIPAEAGLGGGSSDAGAAWRLGRAWRGAPGATTPDDLESLAAIGSDVPFFAAGVPAARVTGIGQRVAPIRPEEHEVVLVHPLFGLATGQVFAELRSDEWGALENDLLAPARRLRPVLDDLLATISAAGGDPRLTGSGPTVYCLSDDPERADALAAALRAAGLDVTRTRTRTDAPTIEAIDEEEE
jgi:4-diphosphocytidyl-2-C-methyl-D-erythritol kinase